MNRPAKSRAGSGGTSESLTDSLYQAVKLKILHGIYQPGAPLREHRLGAEYQVSGLPIRMALTRLAVEGLAEQRPQRGFFVSRITVGDLREAFELRTVIEPAVARLAAERVEQRHLSVLRPFSIDRPRSGASEISTADEIAHDLRFHRLLAEIARNRQLQGAVERFWNQYIRIGYLLGCERRLIVGHGLDSSANHAAIARAVMKRDAATAYERMREHCLSAERNLVLIAGELQDQETRGGDGR